MDHYWRFGPAAVSVNEMCRRAGISKPALYREFGGEEGLQLAALDHYRAQVLVPRQGALEADVPFAAMRDGAIDALTSDLGTPPGCLFTRLRLSPSRVGPDVEARVRELEAEQLANYEAWVRRGVERGEVNPELEASFAARYLDTQFAMILTQMVLGVEPELIRAQARLATRVLLAG